MIVFENGKVLFRGETFECYEENYPNDSYWYALSFHDGKIEKTLVGSTAFGSVGVSDCRVDITPEVKAKLDEYYHKENVKFRWERRKAENALAHKAGITRFDIYMLRDVYDRDTVDAILSLLSVKRFRSEFRKGLAEQVRAWLRGEYEYRYPMSRRQLETLTRYISRYRW